MLENWGQMTKAQDDSTTIDEAIVSAIQAHEEDPESHMGVGESIENHRDNEVIDHPLGSVLADKATQTELVVNTLFENSASFYKYGTPTFSFPGFTISPTAINYAGREVVSIDGEAQQLTLEFEHDFMMQFSFLSENWEGADFKAQVGFDLSGETKNGVGLKIQGGTAKFYVAKDDGSSTSELSWNTYADDVNYVIRMQYVASEEKVYCYINGELLGTLTYPDTSLSNPLYITFEIYETVRNYSFATIRNLTFAQALF